ncbi:unnamed protein product [Rodentolepis nana]|uniref:DPH-type MB domain-containing protein n=1 Tax=Rodentolepis nana TaxID=102285 RepID=A0A0R3TCX7_RODNA|nr:unnamed protein product [Rodentolepis nana]
MHIKHPILMNGILVQYSVMAIFHDEVEIEDMDYDEDEEMYYYPCPCGDRFEISKEELQMGEDIAKCPSCSLIIRVIYDPEDFLPETEEEKEAEVMSVTDKNNEISLIRSVFTPEELVFDDPSFIDEFDLLASQDVQIEDRDVHLTLKLAFSELSVTVLLTVCLPRGYPRVRPSVLLRVSQSTYIINEKALSAALNEWLKEACASHEPIICSLVDWLRSALEEDNRDAYLGRAAIKNVQPADDSHETPSDCPGESSKTTSQTSDTDFCYWIFSHHIRNPKKRKVIVDWARELGLTGCCLPGKPGIIAVEGPEYRVEEYWKRIRVLTWKRIQVKDREAIKERRFHDGFFEVGGTLAEKIGYMKGNGVTQKRIAQIFGFKVDESASGNEDDDGSNSLK